MVHDTASGARHRVAVEPVEKIVRRVPQPRPAAEPLRGHRDVEGVDEVRVEEAPDGRGSAAEADVLPSAASSARRSTSAGSASTKWNVVSDRVNDGLG